jgi:hypothetical protein
MRTTVKNPKLSLHRKYSECKDNEIDYETKDKDKYKMLTSSNYYADSSMCSAYKESANKEEVHSKLSNSEEICISVRKKSIDSCNQLIVRKNFHDHYYNYEEIFDKFKEEEKDIADLENKSVKSEIILKRDMKNAEIYISDQEDKDYDPYKVQEDYIKRMDKEHIQSQFLTYLNKAKPKKDEETNSLKKPCCDACCVIY